MVLHDVRPPSLDALFRPANTFDAILTWPSGSLTGRTFTATLDAASLTVGIASNVMTVSATAAQTTTAGLGSHSFQLTETTGGLSDDLIVGTWVGSDQPNTEASTSTTVVVDGNTVTVSVLGVGATLASLTVTGAVSAGSLAATGAITGASVSATGAVSGATVTASGAMSANTLTVADDLTQRGLPVAQYERITFLPKQMDAASGAAPTFVVDALDYPYWSFPDGVTRSVVWNFAPPRIGVDGSTHLFWSTFEVALIWFNLAASAGAVRWRCEIRNIAIGIDVVNEAPAHDQSVNMTAAGLNVCNAGLVATNVPVSPAFFGSEWAIKVSRIGGDGADTVTNAVGLAMCSFNRVT